MSSFYDLYPGSSNTLVAVEITSDPMGSVVNYQTDIIHMDFPDLCSAGGSVGHRHNPLPKCLKHYLIISITNIYEILAIARH